MTGHKMVRVTGYEIVGDYTLTVDFDDGSRQTVDFEPVLYGPVFGPLRNLETFNQVTLVAYAGCLEWPNGADFDPETLYNWPAYVDEIMAARRQYQATTA